MPWRGRACRFDQQPPVWRRGNGTLTTQASPVMALTDGRDDRVYRSSMSASTAVGGRSGSDAVTSTTQRVKKWAPKVRTGCLTCRSRRVKCDEAKPECNRCIATGRNCQGYRLCKSKAPNSSSTVSKHKSHHTLEPSPAPCCLPEGTNSTHGLSASSYRHMQLHGESSFEMAPIDQQLSNLLGELRVDECGAAPYLRRQERWDNQSDGQEGKTSQDDGSEALNLLLPTWNTRQRFCIPLSMVPSDQQTMRYFKLHFTYVHPYVPVLDQMDFYKQWHTNRSAISPLLLKVLFAIGSRLADEPPSVSNRWLALASRSAGDFMDVPALSTLQALLILLKAREAAPEQGYYYRSWMLVVQCVRMGKDIGLDEHHEAHKSGHTCSFGPSECRLQTRIWQTIFVCETMVGTPQGRHDLSVSIDTVDFEESQLGQISAIGATSNQDIDRHEHCVSRSFTYLARLVSNVRRLHGLYQTLKREKDWGTKPEYLAFEPTMMGFLAQLPPDMSVTMSSDDSSLPVLDNAFVGNLISYYYLTVIIFHRGALGSTVAPESCNLWKHHMKVCYHSAKCLCRLQEAILNQFGLAGLHHMQRGFSFTVYAGLSCIVLHLVAMMSPDPDLNTDARDYFERHMRLLETVMKAWSMPDLQKQIDSFREAFSADVKKPFVLRPSLPYVADRTMEAAAAPLGSTVEQPHQHDSHAFPDVSADHLVAGNYSLHQDQGQRSYSQESSSQATMSRDIYLTNSVTSSVGEAQSVSMAAPTSPHASSWNPVPILEAWNSFFAPPPLAPKSFVTPSLSPQQAERVRGPSSYASPGILSGTMRGLPSSTVQRSGRASPPLPDHEQQSAQLQHGQIPRQYPTVSSVQGFSTNVMWQDLVATMYADGQTGASSGQ